MTRRVATTPDWTSIWRAVFLTVALALFMGCNDSSDDADPAEMPMPTDETLAPTEADTSSRPDPMFPDGLHPNGDGRAIIAQVFARQISSVLDEDEDVGPAVVCLGDSITAGGYPRELADQTRMAVIDAGKAGEKSSGGAGRIAGVLATHNPAYICILYGANDVIHEVPAKQLAANLTAMIQAAQNQGAIPVVGTLTPMSGPKQKYAAAVREANVAIRTAVRGSGARLADLAAAF